MRSSRLLGGRPVEPLRRVLPDRLEQPVAHLAAPLVGDRRATRPTRRSTSVERALVVAVEADRRDGVEREAAREDGEPARAASCSSGREELVAPVHRLARASGGGPATAGARRRGSGSGRRAGSRCRRARAPSPAPRPARSRAAGHRARRRSGPRSRPSRRRRRAWPRSPRPRQEEPDRLRGRGAPPDRRRPTAARAAAPGSRPRPATPSASRLVARMRSPGLVREQRAGRARAHASRRCSQLSRTSRSSRRGARHEQVGDLRSVRPRGSSSASATWRGDERGVGQRREIDEADAVREVRRAPGPPPPGPGGSCRRRRRRSSVTRRASPRQCVDLGELDLAADEARDRDRQVVALVGRPDERRPRAGGSPARGAAAPGSARAPAPRRGSPRARRYVASASAWRSAR